MKNELKPNDFGNLARLPRGIMAWLRPWILLARWDRPAGTWLLLLPSWQGLALGLSQQTDSMAFPLDQLIKLIVAMGLGALLMRGAGCVWNDITDVDYDRAVARTAQRPLPAGLVSQRQALIFMMLQALLGLALLLWAMNLPSQIIAIASLPLVLIYPFMKRFTWFPQAWLGLTFNWGIWVGYSAVVGWPHDWTLVWPALTLYAANWCWTMAYDTIYAHQDKADDIVIGVKSTALWFGAHNRLAIAGFFAAQLLLVLLIMVIEKAAWWAYLPWLAIVAHYAWQIITCDFANGQSCLIRFRANRDAGLLLLLTLALI